MQKLREVYLALTAHIDYVEAIPCWVAGASGGIYLNLEGLSWEHIIIAIVAVWLVCIIWLVTLAEIRWRKNHE